MFFSVNLTGYIQLLEEGEATEAHYYIETVKPGQLTLQNLAYW